MASIAPSHPYTRLLFSLCLATAAGSLQKQCRDIVLTTPVKAEAEDKRIKACAGLYSRTIRDFSDRAVYKQKHGKHFMYFRSAGRWQISLWKSAAILTSIDSALSPNLLKHPWLLNVSQKSDIPTALKTECYSPSPTASPTTVPSASPTEPPTLAPTNTETPTASPSMAPSAQPICPEYALYGVGVDRKRFECLEGVYRKKKQLLNDPSPPTFVLQNSRPKCRRGGLPTTKYIFYIHGTQQWVAAEEENRPPYLLVTTGRDFPGGPLHKWSAEFDGSYHTTRAQLTCFVPTSVPTFAPTSEPTSVPTTSPTADPTASPTRAPTMLATLKSTAAPTTTVHEQVRTGAYGKEDAGKKPSDSGALLQIAALGVLFVLFLASFSFLRRQQIAVHTAASPPDTSEEAQPIMKKGKKKKAKPKAPNLDQPVLV